MKKLLATLFAALAIIVLLSSAYLLIPQTFLSLDNRLRDFLFILRGPVPTTGDVVIIDIDEKSLKAEGQWPWPRNKVARLIQILSDAEVGIIGLDIVFSEEDQTSPHRIAARLGIPSDKLDDYDKMLADTIATAPLIGGYFFDTQKVKEVSTPLVPAVFIEKGVPKENVILSPDNLVLNIPLLQDAFYSSGFFNNTPDPGGMIRRVPLIIRFQESIYPSLDLEMVRIFSGAKRVYIKNSEVGVEKIISGDLVIETDRFGRLIINYRGPSHHFTYLSATDILQGHFDKSDLQGKFILVGTSAIGLADLKATPLDDLMPGVEIHANIIDNLLQKDFIALPDFPEIINISMIVLTVLTALLIFSLINVWLSFPLLLAALYGFYLLFMHLLFSEGLILNILFPLVALFSSYLMALLINYITTLRQKRAIMAVFSKKVSQHVMEDLIANQSDTLLRPRNKEVTVFFSDIRSFTQISERLGHPERVIEMLNTYMTPMVESITAHHGTVDKFIGDAVMAYWNAPLEITRHADEAVTTALQQLEQLQRLNKKLRQQFDVEIRIGIGIHTGEVTIGEMGSVGRSDYTIIGDNVNLASRLEGLNKLYGTTIIISEVTKAALTQHYETRSLDIVKVKGKSHAVEIFEVIAPAAQIQAPELKSYSDALSHYREAKIEEALTLFRQLQEERPSALYALYVERCLDALERGLQDFDVVTTMSTK